MYLHDLPTFYEFVKSTTTKYSSLRSNLNKKFNNKVSFHSKHQINKVNFDKPLTQNRHIYKLKTSHKNKSKKIRYRRNKRQKLSLHNKSRLEKIKANNQVINFSSLDIPDTAYFFLSKGLNFVPSYLGDKIDLKYDALEFIRKLTWKALIKEIEDSQTQDKSKKEIVRDPYFTSHDNIRLKSHKYPEDYNNLVIDDIKFKLMSTIESLEIKKPKSNLTPGEIRDMNWLKARIKNKEIIISPADKGGAILILNYNDVVTTIENELNDPSKFQKIKGDVTKNITKEMRREIDYLVDNDKLSSIDRTLITGKTEEGRFKQNPEFKPETPYAYPLYKIHSLSSDEIKQRKIPPFRLVYAMKHGPLYRFEKWLSPYLTPLSKEYCEDEYILDTKFDRPNK